MDRGGCSVNAPSTASSEKDSGPSWLPPGFRFHPTDEELVTFYLAKKIQNPNFCDQAISEADLNKCEPWELPGKAKMGEKEWYFYSLKDRKYPTGVRTNRATQAGYWKATGKDREVMGTCQQAGSGSATTSSCSSFSLKGKLVGMKKTLVFYNGRAPKGTKSNWVMHEYRAEDALKHFLKLKSSKDEWVLCRVFHKSASGKKMAIEDLELAATLLGNSVSHHKGLDARIAKIAATLPALTEVPWNTPTTQGCSYLSGQNLSASYPSGQAPNNQPCSYVTGDQQLLNTGASGLTGSSVFTALYQHYHQQVNSIKPEPWENSHLPFLQDYGQLQVGQQGGNPQVPVSPWAASQSVDGSSGGRPSPDSCGSSLEFTRSPHVTMSTTLNHNMPHIIPRLPSDLESFWLYNSEH